ncbi:Sesquipedalian-1 [Oryzias melastigma]|uniref:Sesquipedalian n=1 Tax=Oryzias melastigma TaxID=30732 RepID=A0A834CID3_ORYME|nr:sesquipedalian-1 [Oryzias melastigma]XP_024131441.1 sesquipedalian-1 [Oryzias melastigma]XP_024131442.1 sesquipedalian-1 [Oryzias melastigma]XP_024131443.1 sesquipedalian-1 [Oryzias melastigma]XP_024131446.1 sesquipedalian-1 [Oryzias melastigma]XP_024131447.1 sesquipedalian-1 [Oryzias melastigma]XP_024131449.1 sesquipedalian-1 [Oryzias melastigma]XP_036069477.1 sesquipedalian-1 [Oryzias melastigma]XP_036069478.1 sesquipedalian-1 [Oryzias melastigma]XP_036069479.1 sesquipedalian-1 [Oryzi
MKLNERSVAHYATCDSPPDKTGFLFKKGERNTAYHRRWFVLKGNMLFYFEDRDSREPIGVIVLEGCTVELCDSIEEFAFAIKFDCAKSRVYKLVAESQASMESWVKALSRASFDYMRLVVKELERQLEEIQEAAGGGVGDGQQGRLKPSPLNQMVQSRSASSFLSSSASSLSSSSSTPSMTTPHMAQKSQQEEVQLISRGSRENGVIWTKPLASCANGSGEGTASCAVWEGSADSGVPPVPPRRRGASLESPVCPGTGCFSKLHDWYGKEVMELREQWLQSQ